MNTILGRLYWPAYYLHFKRFNDHERAHYAGTLSCMANFGVIAALPLIILTTIDHTIIRRIGPIVPFIPLICSVFGLALALLVFKKTNREAIFRQMTQLTPAERKNYLAWSIGIVFGYTILGMTMMFSHTL